MTIGTYRINFDALLARIVYQWRAQFLLGLLLLSSAVGLGSGYIPPVWRGRVDLTIIAAHGATVLVDGRTWPRQLYAGHHTIVATMPDGRAAWTELALKAGESRTLTLPTGLRDPRERALPAAAPGSRVEQVWWADNAWRVLSVPEQRPPSDGDHLEPTTPVPVVSSGQTVAVGSQGVARLSTLDAYAGLADQVHIGNQLREAVYQPDRAVRYGDQIVGELEVRGWGDTPITLPISAPLALVRFSPDGAALLVAERIIDGGEQLYLERPAQPRTPVVAVPGQVVRLSWRPDGSAVVLHSVAGQRLTLTLVRLHDVITAAVIADLNAADYAGALVPMTWDDSGLLWVAPDGAGAMTFWSAPLHTLIPERKHLLDARALTLLSDGTLRAVTLQGPHVVIGRYQDEIFIGETVVPHVPATTDLVGVWQGDQLLLQGHAGAWLLEIDEGEINAEQGGP